MQIDTELLRNMIVHNYTDSTIETPFDIDINNNMIVFFYYETMFGGRMILLYSSILVEEYNKLFLLNRMDKINKLKENICLKSVIK